MDWRITDAIVPAIVALVGAVLIGAWVGGSVSGPLEMRVPGMDRPSGAEGEERRDREEK